MNKQIKVSGYGILVTVMLVFLIYLPGCRDSEPSIRYTEGFVQAGDDIELYYQIAGSGPDTLIMLHGGPGADSGYLAPDLEPLAESYVLVYYDQRGSGRSTLLTDLDLLTVDAHVADLEAVREHFGLERVTFFGHSWGALLSAFYAIEYPENVNEMVLASPASLRFEPYFPQLRANIMAWMDDATRDEVGTAQGCPAGHHHQCPKILPGFLGSLYSRLFCRSG
jgi:proline-specific peptidase